MKKENKKIFSAATIAILLAAVVSAAVTLSINSGIVWKRDNLTVKILADKTEGSAPLKVKFSSVVTNSEGEVKYLWDFGNGITSKEEEPCITYEDNGTFTCTLTVTDETGNKASDSIEILSKKNKPPVVTISINYNTVERDFIPILPKIIPYAGNQQQLINFLAKKNPYILGEGKVECTAQVTDPEDDEIVSYSWEVKPDPGVTITGKTIYATYRFNGSHIKIPDLYTWRQGRYVVTLTVEDSYGNTANASIEFQVDKSTKETMREVRLRLIKSAFDTWNIYGTPLLGPAITMILLSMWKFNNFTGMKTAGLLLFKYLFGLDIDSDVVAKQVQEFFNEHPKIKEKLKTKLLEILDSLEKQRDAEEDPVKKEKIQDKIDNLYTILENLGMINCRPVISNPFPVDGSEYVDRNYPKVYVNISDKEGDKFDVFIYGNYVENKTLKNQSSGIFNASLITPLPAETEIVWHVEVTDNLNRTVAKTYRFTTFWE
ncbi:MAG: PKD domain-containing protein [Thermoplasmata archaeon]|nr:MAG: PKD domain-containing protein [Thermoplasmata archaeon]